MANMIFQPIRMSIDDYLQHPLQPVQVNALTKRLHLVKHRNDKFRAYVMMLFLLVMVLTVMALFYVSSNNVTWVDETQSVQLFVLAHPTALILLAFVWFDWPTALIHRKTLPSIELSNIEFIIVPERVGGAFEQVEPCTIAGNYAHIEKINQFLRRIEGRPLLRFEGRLLQYVAMGHNLLSVEPIQLKQPEQLIEAIT